MADSLSSRILLVDDDPDIARLVQHVLETAGLGPVFQVRTGREALEALTGIDIVLLDHQLPDTSGLEVLRAIRALPAPPAIILITAHGNESLAATALRLGADDYLAKDSALADLLPQNPGAGSPEPRASQGARGGGAGSGAGGAPGGHRRDDGDAAS